MTCQGKRRVYSESLESQSFEIEFEVGHSIDVIFLGTSRTERG